MPICVPLEKDYAVCFIYSVFNKHLCRPFHIPETILSFYQHSVFHSSRQPCGIRCSYPCCHTKGEQLASGYVTQVWRQHFNLSGLALESTPLTATASYLSTNTKVLCTNLRWCFPSFPCCHVCIEFMTSYCYLIFYDKHIPHFTNINFIKVQYA